VACSLNAMGVRMRGLVLVVVMGLAGCVSTTDPVGVGPDTFMVTLNARAGLKSDGELLSQSIQQANAFRSRTGRIAEVLDSKTSGTQGWTPQNNQVVFKCVAKP
jgi:hypothetical protein